MNQRIRFYLSIDYNLYLSVYQGFSKTIRTKAVDGRIIEFPASKVQQFLTRDGIQGIFDMELTSANRIVAINRIR